jgi:hypothetical protein
MPKLTYLVDSRGEETIPLSQVPDLPIIGRGTRGRRVAPSTIYRWASRGCRGVQLEVIRVGGVLKTTVSAVERFAHRLSGLPAEPDAKPQRIGRRAPSPRQTRKVLDRAGI